MNDLIDGVFGDDYISLNCEAGECLHISQVPGYVVSIIYSPCCSDVVLMPLLQATSKARSHEDGCSECRWCNCGCIDYFSA